MEKKSENIKKEKSLWTIFKKYWFVGLAIIIMPMATTVATSLIHSPISSFSESNDWIGFFGSYMGAIIGGLITLLVMYRSIENGDKNVNATMNQNK